MQARAGCEYRQEIWLAVSERDGREGEEKTTSGRDRQMVRMMGVDESGREGREKGGDIPEGLFMLQTLEAQQAAAGADEKETRGSDC